MRLALTSPRRRNSTSTGRRRSRPGHRAFLAAAIAVLALGHGPAPAIAQEGAAGDTTVRIKPWLPSNGPPQSKTLEQQRTGVYRDQLKSETRRFELHGDKNDYRALDRNRSFQNELGRLNRVAPPAIQPPYPPSAPRTFPK